MRPSLAHHSPRISPPQHRAAAAAAAAAAHRRASSVVAAAAPRSRAAQQQQPQQQQQAVYVQIPESRDDALQQAADALAARLKPLFGGGGPSAAAPGKLAKARKGFGAAKPGAGAAGGAPAAGGGTRFAVELPVADTGAAATAALAADLLRRLPAPPAGSWTAVYSDEAAASAAAAAGGAGARAALHLRAACRADELAGALLIVGARVADVALVEQLLTEVWAGGPAVVALNAEWRDGADLPAQYAGLARSFDVAYSFLPISIQGLIGGQEGAVLRRGGGSTGAAAAPWQILAAQRDGRHLQVGSMKRRPSQSDLELAFMNASAAASPLAGAARAARGLFDRVRGGSGGS